MGPTMAEHPTASSEIATPAPANHHPPRRSRPRVREVSSRFMSPVTTTSTSSVQVKSPVIPKPIPSTPSESHASKLHSLRRSQTDLRPRYADENRPDSLNRSSVSPIRSSSKPRSAVKLFKETSRNDTPAPAPAPSRLLRHRGWDTAASKLIQATTSDNNSNNHTNNGDDNSEDVRSIDGDCESVKSEPCDNAHNVNSRVSTPCSRSMDEQQMGALSTMKGSGNEAAGAAMMMRGSVKVARSLNLPPMPPMANCGKSQGAVEVKKAVRKGSSQQDDAHRLRLMYNHFVQWRFANAKAQASMIAHKEKTEKLLYSLGVKIAELQDSVKSKRVEFGLLKEAKILCTILDAQMPYLDEWSTLDESYSSSLLELGQGLLNVLSQLPLVGNVKADPKEIEEALHQALKATEMICLQVQSFMPKAEHVGSLIFDLARVYSGEITHVEECGDLLSRTHLSQVEECSLRGQAMQFHQCNLNRLQEEQF